jgi:hypothetical protein
LKEALPGYLCDKSKGTFYSNPFDQRENSANEFTLALKCEVVFLEYKEDDVDYA